jgi:hypothetical protein
MADADGVKFAIALVCLTLVGCSAGSNGALTLDEVINRPPSETVSVQGSVVILYGKAMLCSELTKSSPPQCEAGLWLSGPLGQLEKQDFQSDQGVRWAESVTLRGTVDGDGFFTLAP